MENIGALTNLAPFIRPEGDIRPVLQTVLKVNQILQGEVLQKLDGSSIVLGVGKYRVPATTNIELHLGDKFQFRVEVQNNEIILRLLGEKQQAQIAMPSFQQFQKTVGRELPSAELVRKLAEILFVAGNIKNVGEEAVAELFAASGKTAQPSKVVALVENILQANPKVLESLPAIVAALSEQTTSVSLEKLAQKPGVPSLPVDAAAVKTPLAVDENLSLAKPLPSQGQQALDLEGNKLGVESPVKQTAPTPVSVDETVVTQANLKTASADSAKVTKQTLNLNLPGEKQSAVAPQNQPVSSPEQEVVQQAVWRARDVLRALLPARELLNEPVLHGKLEALAKHLEKLVVFGERVRPEVIQLHAGQNAASLENYLLKFAQGERVTDPKVVAGKDLKGLLFSLEMELRHVVEGSKKGGSYEEERALKDLLVRVQDLRVGVEAKQVQNALRNDLGQPIHFQIPFLDNRQLKTAEFFYEKRESAEQSASGQQGGSHHLVFLLEMSWLGPLRVDAIVRQKKVDLHIQTQEEDAAQWIEEHLALLGDSLRGIGLQVGHLECSACYRKEENQLLAMNLPVFQERHLLDLEG